MTMYEPTPQEAEAISLLTMEKSSFEEGEVWVTDKVAYVMRDVVKRARKNYFGIYDNEYDPITGRKKVWVPMTEWIVDTILKNIDIDTKDIRVYAKKREASFGADVFRYILRNKLDKVRFGTVLNKTLRNMVTDGTAIMKVWKEGRELKVKTIDRLSLYCDPSVESLDESSGITEVNTLTIPEFRDYKHWANIKEVEGATNVDKTNVQIRGTSPLATGTQVPYVKVYERYGYASKFILTGNEDDREEYVYLLIVASNIDVSPVVHYIKEVKGHPYQEFKMKDLLNRFDGRGAPEMVFAIQEYVNEVVNTRRAGARIIQMGMWRVDPSVTDKQLKNLHSTSAIKAPQGAIERINSGTVDPSAYRDEEIGYMWGQRVTGTQREDEIAASKPATNALIEERGASKGYGLVIENFLLALAKVLEEKMVPIIVDLLTPDELIRITGDPMDLRKIQEPFVRNLVRSKNQQAIQEIAQPLYVTKEEEDEEVERVMLEMEAQGEIRYVEVFKEAFSTDYEIDIDPAEDMVNRAILSQQLNTALSTLVSAGVPATELKDVMSEMFDTLGLPGERLVSKIQTQVQTAGPQAGQPLTQESEARMMPTEGGQISPQQ